MQDYPRYVTSNFKKFNPLTLAEETKKIVSQGKLAKYTGFSVDEDYSGVVTGNIVGCCLRCSFCWADRSRDFPEECGNFYSPKEAFMKMKDIAIRRRIRNMRLSGAEPTICKEHLMDFLSYIENSDFNFILETNGILFSDENYVKQISRFKKPLVRVSIKAANPKDFAKITGALPESFDLQFQAIRNLIKYHVNFIVAICSDPRIMGRRERDTLIRKVGEIDPNLTLNLDEETLLPSKRSLERLRYGGFQALSFGFLLPSQTRVATNLLRRIPSKHVRQIVKRLMYSLFSRTRRPSDTRAPTSAQSDSVDARRSIDTKGRILTKIDKVAARTYREGDDTTLISFFNETFKNYAGFVPRTLDYWSWYYRSRFDLEDDGIIILEQGGQIVAYSLVGSTGSLWEFCYDTKNERAEEIANLLIQKSVEYAVNKGADEIKLHAPESDQLIHNACMDMGFTSTRFQYLFLSVLDFSKLLNEILEKSHNKELEGNTFQITLTDAPSWMEKSISVNFNGQPPYTKAQPAENSAVNIEMNISTLSQIIFKKSRLLWPLLKREIRIAPFSKTFKAMKFLEKLRLEDSWFTPLGDCY